MTANELRIGNLVLLNNPKYRPKETGLVHKVVGISPKPNNYSFSEWSISLELLNDNPYKDTYGQFIDFLKPIELTDKDVKQYGHFNLIKVNEEYFVCFGNYKTQIKYLHELQNYYYLVNHEEL